MNQIKDESYNGWKNYETWNVALWIENDEGLYKLAQSCRRSRSPYKAFVDSLQEIGCDTENGIDYMTPDQVEWNDSALDIEALDSMIREL